MPVAVPPDAPPVRVALDAMGGDHAPAATVVGALSASGEGIEVVLVGRSDDLRRELERAGHPQALRVVDAPDVVTMDEEPALALRAKPRASIRVGAQLVAAGEADALVSAGSTGATLAAALLVAGRAPGIRRPAVAAVIPLRPRSGEGPHPVDAGVVLLDAGASPDVQPEALVSYARMGAAYAEVRGVRRPRIGLLNVGAEPGKGNALAREAFALLEDVEGFVGNAEPDAVLAGHVDVAVTDGFTGNVFLKTVEAGALPGSADDADRPGAAVLVGVDADVLVAHGAAGPADIAAALRTARQVASARLSRRIAELLDATAVAVRTPR